MAQAKPPAPQGASPGDKTLTHRCRHCLKDLTLVIPQEHLQAGAYPIKIENVHGDPPHKLIVLLNKRLEVESFEIKEDLGEKSKFTVGILEEVLGGIGLTQKEVELYFHCTRLGPVSVGEMALLVDLPNEEILPIAQKFVTKGLFKEILGAKQYFQALPPYAALLFQLQKFGEFITTIKDDTPRDLQRSFSEFEAKAKGVQNLKEFVTYLTNIKQEVSTRLTAQKTTLEQNLGRIKNQQGTLPLIDAMREQSSSLLDKQVENLDHQLFENVSLIEQQVGKLDDQMTQSNQMLDQQFQFLDSQLGTSIARMDKQVETIAGQLTIVQDKINRNLEKLRLGVIQQTVQDVIQKIMSGEIESIRQTFQTEIGEPFRRMIEELKQNLQQKFASPVRKMLEGMKDSFQNQFANSVRELNEKFKESFQSEFGAPFRSILEQLSQKIQGVSMDASKIEEDLRGIFSSILTQFEGTMTEASTKVQSISDSVMASFGDLRTSFAQNVIITLDEVLGKIITRLNLSTQTIAEFWDEAKRVVRLSAKDIWFVRTTEGIKAQLIDATSRAKAKVLVIAPTLNEIDVPSLLKAPRFVNVRVACKINPHDPKDQQILDTLAAHVNIAVRNWDHQNLWAVNRDFEEIIIGIVSRDTAEGSGGFDVAGIGSTLSEHIKIFAGILEDAWVGARKDIGYVSNVSSSEQALAPAPAGTPTPAAKPAKFPKPLLKPAPAPEPAAEAPVAHSPPLHQKIAPVHRQAEPAPAPAPEPAAEAPATSVPTLRQKLAPTPGRVKPLASPVPGPAPVVAPPTPEPAAPQRTAQQALAPDTGGRMPDIIAEIDALKRGIDQCTSAADFAKAIELLRDFIFERKGFSTVLHDMKNWVNQLRRGAWDSATKDTMRKRVDAWKEKLLS